MKRCPFPLKLSSLFYTARRFSSKHSSPSSVVSQAETTPQLGPAASSLDTLSPSSSTSVSPVLPASLVRCFSKKSSKLLSRSKKASLKRTGDLSVSKLQLGGQDKHDYLAQKKLSADISSLLTDTSPSPVTLEAEKKSLETVLDIPWLENMNQFLSLRHREVSRERKQKWIFNSTRDRRIQQLIKTCTQKIGAEAAMTVFEKLGRETGLKEFNAMIDVCLQKARATDDEDVALQEVYNTYQLLSSMKEQGLELCEATYGPVLMYMTEMGMEKGFYLVTDLVKGDTGSSILKFSYYEMILHIRINDEEKIRQLCEDAISSDKEDKHDVIGHYLVALCESNTPREEILFLLNVLDLTQISSKSLLTNIFKSLGKQQLESIAEKFLLVIKDYGEEVEDISEFMFHYSTNLPNLAVEDVILKYKSLHKKLEVPPSSTTYGKLITYSCDLHEVYIALDMADEMSEVGLTLPIEVLQSILHASEETYEYCLVRRIRSLIDRQNMNQNGETFRSLINLATRMKNFSVAFDMLKDMEKLNLNPTATLYNTIMAGYFREKNFSGVMMVLRQMKAAGVKPDSQTFSYLISNCDSEEEIIKNYEEMKQAGVQPTKSVYMSLISAYAACGQFEKAKQVINEKGIPGKILNEIRSALVSALASNDQISGALIVYDEIKKNKGKVEPKAVNSVIENLQREDGQLDRMLEVLKELDDNDPDSWSVGACRILHYCVRFNHISVAVDLLKQLEDLAKGDELKMEAVIDEVFSIVPDGSPGRVQTGLDLLRAIKKELRVSPSRKVYDFLLSACVYAKDLDNATFIWKEYQEVGLPYNVLSFLRMYQAFLACGDHRTARLFRRKVPKDDPHVRYLLEEYRKIYLDAALPTKRRKKKRKTPAPQQVSSREEDENREEAG